MFQLHDIVWCKAPRFAFPIRITGRKEKHEFGDIYEVIYVPVNPNLVQLRRLRDNLTTVELANAFEKVPQHQYQTLATPVNPFKKGDKVKMTAHAIATGLDTVGGPQGHPSSRTGEVVTNPVKPDMIRVRRDGRRESRMYHISFWEHITSNHETQ